jgi:alginate O-acetyltransferase complex protein AlgI
MLFNSIVFIIFLFIAFPTYWFLLRKNLKLQNLFIAVASYVFYGWWDWRFLGLIFASTIVDYICGIQIGKSSQVRTRKLYLVFSMVFNLGLLGFFKYYNFFADSLSEAFSGVGMHLDPFTLNIVLPVGISFYTFQTMSYTLDIYYNKLNPTKDFVAFAAFVSFFPQLVAGPIERASNLLPQFYKSRSVDYARLADGARQILWGLFKKLVVADNCALLVNDTFLDLSFADHAGVTLILSAIFFGIQIYCDFSGYSDIAIGLAKWFGFDLMTNFRTPYFARDIAEFWRRWHISLTTWFRDYLYIPLGGSRMSKIINIRNIVIVFLVSGFWHGANWTFIAWGALNAMYFLPIFIRKKNRKNTGLELYPKGLPTLREFSAILLTFGLTTIAWVFFRAQTIERAFEYIYYTGANLFTHLGILKLHMKDISLLYIAILFFIEYKFRNHSHPFEISGLSKGLRWSIYIVLFFVIIFNFQYHEPQEFIYFQF